NRDPRAAVVIFDATSPYESVQVQGTASIEDDPDGVLVDELSHKYTGGPYPSGEGGIGFSRPNPQCVIVRLTADKVATSCPSSSARGLASCSPRPGASAVAVGIPRPATGTAQSGCPHRARSLSRRTRGQAPGLVCWRLFRADMAPAGLSPARRPLSRRDTKAV